ncbi:hypothetical protein JCM6882_000927 [Rhodosporidiobolus microsporus]
MRGNHAQALLEALGRSASKATLAQLVLDTAPGIAELTREELRLPLEVGAVLLQFPNLRHLELRCLLAVAPLPVPPLPAAAQLATSALEPPLELKHLFVTPRYQCSSIDDPAANFSSTIPSLFRIETLTSLRLWWSPAHLTLLTWLTQPGFSLSLLDIQTFGVPAPEVFAQLGTQVLPVHLTLERLSILVRPPHGADDIDPSLGTLTDDAYDELFSALPSTLRSLTVPHAAPSEVDVSPSMRRYLERVVALDLPLEELLWSAGRGDPKTGVVLWKRTEGEEAGERWARAGTFGTAEKGGGGGNAGHAVPAAAPPSPQALLAAYSQTPTRTVTLADLSQWGTPPLEEDKLLMSAERTRRELLAGLARRVSQHLSLPFLPATNPSLAKVHALYSSAFFNLTTVPEVKTLADNDKLCRVVAQMVEEHRDNIPLLAKGFKESRKYLPDSVITDFLDRAIRNRISLRLMAEQHLSLSAASLPFLRPTISSPSSPSSSDPTSAPSAKDPRVEPSARPPSSSLSASRLGVLDLALSPYDLLSTSAEYVTLLCESTYGVAPPYRIEVASSPLASGASPSALTVGAVGSHIEYIVTELLKNAFRATVEHNVPKKDDGRDEDEDDVFRFEDTPHAHMLKSDFPEVVVTVSAVPGALTIRIRDRGGGIPPENASAVFSYAFTSVPMLPDPDSDPDSPGGGDLYGGTSNAGYMGGVGGGPQGPETPLTTNIGSLAGLGFGLPLSRIYAQYFGGSLDLVTMYGWGTDVYLVLKTV